MPDTKDVRPTREDAEAAIYNFLAKELGEDCPRVRMIEDGGSAWAFWILDDDTTSYLRSDLSIQWLGTGWEAENGTETAPLLDSKQRDAVALMTRAAENGDGFFQTDAAGLGKGRPLAESTSESTPGVSAVVRRRKP